VDDSDEAAHTKHRASNTAWPGQVLPGAADLLQYRRACLARDLMAGLAVWAVLVPQGLSYGELAGLSTSTCTSATAVADFVHRARAEAATDGITTKQLGPNPPPDP
jgi:sulfate permease family protein